MVLFSLTIVRHGETAANAKLIIQGQSEEPLNERGRAQAQSLGAALAAQPAPVFTHAYASDLGRAAETAQILLGQLAQPPPLAKDPRLRERCFGCLERRPLAEFRKAALAAGESHEDFVPDGAENQEQLQSRVVDFFRHLCEMVEASSLQSAALLRPAPVRRLPSRSSQSLLASTAEEEEASVDSGILSDSPPLAAQLSVLTDVPEPTPQAPATVPIRTASSTASPLLSPSFHLAQRKVSVQSVASDDSCFADLDAKVLVVTHGGSIRALFRYFLEVLKVSFPGGSAAALRRCPNAAMTSFVISYEGGEVTSFNCLDVHSSDHLHGLAALAPNAEHPQEAAAFPPC